MNYRETRELLTISYALGDISDEEFLILNEAFTSNNLEFPYKNYLKFQLDTMDEAECVADFRFQKEDILILAAALQVPTRDCLRRCRRSLHSV